MRRGGAGGAGGAGAGAAWLWLWLGAALALPPPAPADLVFHVPEVLVQHAAASRPVGTGTGRGNGTRNGTEHEGGREGLELRYEEYFVEHDVSTAAARRAARALDLNTVTTAGCGVCSKRDIEYCETRVLADHCCCERRFWPEPFPWLPHTCYVGPRQCKPLAPNCVEYALIRNCCCKKILAERWKSILSKSTSLGVGGVSLLLLSMLLFVAYL